MQTLLAFIFVFGIIVLVHEFGHFYFAKRAGILVREFSIGMGPKLFQTHKNETSYTLRVLPLGGYVLMAGYEDGEDLRLGMPVTLHLDSQDKVKEIDLSNDSVETTGIPIDVLDYDFETELFIKGSIGGNPDNIERFDVNESALLINEDGTKLQIAPAHRQVQNASLINRILTNFGGPLNNFILSIIAFMALAFIQGGVVSEEPIIGEPMADSPIIETQIEQGDRVLSVDDKEISTWMEMVAIVQQHPDEELLFEVEKPSGEILEERVTPKLVTTDDGTEVGQIGVMVHMEDGFLDKVTFGFTETWQTLTAVFSSVIQLITGQLSVDALGGPVAIYEITGEVTRTGGMLGIISFIGFLSANLGLMNLLPIPALDGGKLVLNVIEAVRGKPIKEEHEAVVNLIGVVLLLLLMLFVTWNDIQRFFFN